MELMTCWPAWPNVLRDPGKKEGNLRAGCGGVVKTNCVKIVSHSSQVEYHSAANEDIKSAISCLPITCLTDSACLIVHIKIEQFRKAQCNGRLI